MFRFGLQVTHVIDGVCLSAVGPVTACGVCRMAVCAECASTQRNWRFGEGAEEFLQKVLFPEPIRNVLTWSFLQTKCKNIARDLFHKKIGRLGKY